LIREGITLSRWAPPYLDPDPRSAFDHCGPAVAIQLLLKYLMIRCECDWRVLGKLKKGTPWPKHATDSLLMACIRRTTLDHSGCLTESKYFKWTSRLALGGNHSVQISCFGDLDESGAPPAFDNGGYGGASHFLFVEIRNYLHHLVFRHSPLRRLPASLVREVPPSSPSSEPSTGPPRSPSASSV
jgi:hypothetical protein